MIPQKINVEDITPGDTIEIVVDKKSIIVAQVVANGVVPDLTKSFINGNENNPFEDEYAEGIVLKGGGPEDSMYYVFLTEGPEHYLYTMDNRPNRKCLYNVFTVGCEIEYYVRSILLLETK